MAEWADISCLVVIWQKQRNGEFVDESSGDTLMELYMLLKDSEEKKAEENTQTIWNKTQHTTHSLSSELNPSEENRDKRVNLSIMQKTTEWNGYLNNRIHESTTTAAANKMAADENSGEGVHAWAHSNCP